MSLALMLEQGDLGRLPRLRFGFGVSPLGKVRGSDIMPDL